MVTIDDVLAAVDAAFADLGAAHAAWPDPHPDRQPADEEYSRVTRPERYLVVGARADAWITALTGLGLATAEQPTVLRWRDVRRPVHTRVDLLTPVTPGAAPVTIVRSALGDVADCGITLGLGLPAVEIAMVPDCGCDACDSGSADLLELLDRELTTLISGEVRHLQQGARTIISRGEHGLGASGFFLGMGPDDIPDRAARRSEVDAVLADPTGWIETTGTSWLA